MTVATFLTAILTHYRVPFHERVRSGLARHGVTYQLVHGQPLGAEIKKNDTSTLPWAIAVDSIPVTVAGRSAIWQPILRRRHHSDLMIIGQENKLLVNYPLQLMPAMMRPRLALFGHGRNFQSRNPDGLAERFKRIWATKCDWWFGYTDETRRHIESLGFPADRITVFNNAVDTSAIRRDAEAATPERLAALRSELGLAGDNVGVYVGGLYADKRLDFLVDAADRVRAAVPDFELVVVGGGPGRAELDQAAATRPWLKLAGPRFGREKAEIMRLGKLFLMPGLVGLAILDAGCVGLPIVTTAFPYHSPEIAYLAEGENGTMVADWRNPAAYADAVITLLGDPGRLAAMAAAAKRISAGYSIESMAERFVDGVVAALAAPKR
jgi:glycosyltransferase involved in cell wall biosynthesis